MTPLEMVAAFMDARPNDPTVIRLGEILAELVEHVETLAVTAAEAVAEVEAFLAGEA